MLAHDPDGGTAVRCGSPKPLYFWDTAGNTDEGTVMGRAILVRSQLSCLGLLEGAQAGLSAGLVRKMLLAPWILQS